MSDRQAPAFSSRSLDAATAQLERWGVVSSAPLDERIGLLNGALSFWTAHKKYGVEDAVHSGTRVRLLDQMPDANLDTARMNCAETGANMLLLVHAMGCGREARLLRYNWGTTASDHLGLVLLDDEREPTFIDPLANHYGRVRLSKHGVFFRPNGASRPKKMFKGSWSLLNEEDLVRHIRYLNSPLGFFPYYENGQVIRADAKEYPRFEYQVQTNKEDVTFRVVCDDMMPDIYTLERTLQHYAGRAIERTTEYLHADVGFARIEKPVVSLDERGQCVRLRGRPYDKRSMAIWLAAGHLRHRELIQHDKTNEAHQAMAFWNRFPQTFNAHQEQMCKEMLDEEKEQGEEQKKYGYLSNTIRLYRRLRRLDVRERQQMMGVRMTSDMFAANYFEREELESARVRWSEDITEVCTQYITTRRAMFAKETQAFFTSPVYENLVGQYREALMVKHAAQGLLRI